MNLQHVKAHTKSKPYAALKDAKHEQLRRAVEHEAALFKRMERALNRLVAFNVRRETA